MGVQGGRGVGDRATLAAAAAVDDAVDDADVDAADEDAALLLLLLNPAAMPPLLLLAPAPENPRATMEKIAASERLPSVERARRRDILFWGFDLFFFDGKKEKNSEAHFFFFVYTES